MKLKKLLKLQNNQQIILNIIIFLKILIMINKVVEVDHLKCSLKRKLKIIQ